MIGLNPGDGILFSEQRTYHKRRIPHGYYNGQENGEPDMGVKKTLEEDKLQENEQHGKNKVEHLKARNLDAGAVAKIIPQIPETETMLDYNADKSDGCYHKLNSDDNPEEQRSPDIIVPEDAAFILRSNRDSLLVKAKKEIGDYWFVTDFREDYAGYEEGDGRNHPDELAATETPPFKKAVEIKPENGYKAGGGAQHQ